MVTMIMVVWYELPLLFRAPMFAQRWIETMANAGCDYPRQRPLSWQNFAKFNKICVILITAVCCEFLLVDESHRQIETIANAGCDYPR